MGQWLGLHLELEPERPELPLRASGNSSDVVVIVRQFDPCSVWYRHHDAWAIETPAREQEAGAK